MTETLAFKDETYAIRGAIFAVYKTLGPGFLEDVYQKALEAEFRSKAIIRAWRKTRKSAAFFGGAGSGRADNSVFFRSLQFFRGRLRAPSALLRNLPSETLRVSAAHVVKKEIQKISP